MADLSDYRRLADRRLELYRAAKSTARKERAALKAAKAHLAAVREAREVARAVGEAVQREAHRHIAGLASRCLAAVFGEDAYTFEIRFERKRDRTEARPVLLREGVELGNPKEEAGGGVIDVLSFALRVAALLARRPEPRRLLVLDEPFKHLSAEYRPRVRSLVETLAEELGFQFLIVTHHADLESGKVVRIGRGRSTA